jgi:hypothetical protein
MIVETSTMEERQPATTLETQQNQEQDRYTRFSNVKISLETSASLEIGPHCKPTDITGSFVGLVAVDFASLAASCAL